MQKKKQVVYDHIYINTIFVIKLSLSSLLRTFSISSLVSSPCFRAGLDMYLCIVLKVCAPYLLHFSPLFVTFLNFYFFLPIFQRFVLSTENCRFSMIFNQCEVGAQNYLVLHPWHMRETLHYIKSKLELVMRFIT